MVWKRKRIWGLLLILLIAGLSVVWAQGARANRRHQRVVEAMAWTVINKTVIIDPGHGGVDPGAVGPAGTLEKDVNLAVAKKLGSILKKAGAEVIYIRTTDEDLGTNTKNMALRKTQDLQKRISIVQNSGADIYINLQTNSFGTRWTGAQTFFYPGNAEGEKLAKCIQFHLREYLKNTNRKAQPMATSFMLRNIMLPGAMVEVGFISNPKEEKLLNNPGYQEKLAWSIYAGLVSYLAKVDCPY
ncbi:MAG: N-acetylmuramoyl-L-alanine amidase [Bacillota bacterium]